MQPGDQWKRLGLGVGEVHHNSKIGLHGCWLVTERFKNIRKESTIAATFGHPIAKEISASGGFTPLPLIRSSAPGPRWALRPHTHPAKNILQNVCRINSLNFYRKTLQNAIEF